MEEMKRGTVKWFNDAKGYGFIQSDDGDVFVHYSVIDASGFKTLKDGEEVDYSLQAGDKGLHAKQVIRVNPPVAEQPAKSNQAQKSPLAQQIEIERIAENAAQGILSHEAGAGSTSLNK